MGELWRARLVEQYGPQPAGGVISILRQACESLEEAHAAGMVHRDVKPVTCSSAEWAKGPTSSSSSTSAWLRRCTTMGIKAHRPSREPRQTRFHGARTGCLEKK